VPQEEDHVECSVPQQRPLPLHSRHKLEIEGCAFNSNHKGCALNTLRRHITVTPHRIPSPRYHAQSQIYSIITTQRASRVVLVLRVLLLVIEDV